MVKRDLCGEERNEMNRLVVKNLHAEIDGKAVLKGLDLSIKPGEVHAVMGPNGAGKSTLSHVLVGKTGYVVTQGEVLLDGRDLLAMPVEERARAGVFLAFQYPTEIPGVSNMYFLREALNAVRAYRGEDALDAAAFMRLARERSALVKLEASFLKRGVNENFSGGEKKRNEIFQMAMLEPRLAILDETDSGLDIDALREVSHGINALRDGERSMLMITHYQRLLDYVVPDFVHVLADGRIVETGGPALALRLESEGYVGLEAQA